MAIESVKKVYILASRELEGGILDVLQAMGVVEVSAWSPEETAAGPVEDRDLDRKLELAERAASLIAKHSPPPGFFEGQHKVILSRGDLAALGRDEKMNLVLERCRILDGELAGLRGARAKLSGERAQVAPFAPMRAELASLASPGKTVGSALGQMPLPRWPAFRKSLEAAGREIFLEEVGTDGKFKYMAVLYAREAAAAVEECLREAEFSPLSLARGEAPGAILAGIDAELATLDDREKMLAGELRDLAGQKPRLLALADHYRGLKLKETVRQFLLRTGEAVCLTGWVPLRQKERVERELRVKFAAIEVFFADPEEGDEVPVLLHNRRTVEPFEVITDLYGRPAYRGIDPTPYLSIFFAAFFGFCLTDAGYGLVLMALTAFLWRRARKAGAAGRRKFFELFFLGGVATVFLGAMVGTWFGITVEWKLFDALEDLMVFFGLALGLGLIHILTGLAIKMVRNYRAGDREAAVLDQGLWMVVILGLAALGLSGVLRLPSWAGPASAIASLGGALGIVFFQGRQADKTWTEGSGAAGWAYRLIWLLLTGALTMYLLKMGRPVSGWLSLALAAAVLAAGGRHLLGILGRLGLGLYSLYGISGFLGDTLSYSRLVALGLTTGIVGMIINKMAGIAQGAPAIIGWPLALAILVFGHAFNLMINLLGAFVHSCRLQYVEFFTKFYEAGGRAFRPFGFDNRHTIMQESGEV